MFRSTFSQAPSSEEQQSVHISGKVHWCAAYKWGVQAEDELSWMKRLAIWHGSFDIPFAAVCQRFCQNTVSAMKSKIFSGTSLSLENYYLVFLRLDKCLCLSLNSSHTGRQEMGYEDHILLCETCVCMCYSIYTLFVSFISREIMVLHIGPIVWPSLQFIWWANMCRLNLREICPFH